MPEQVFIHTLVERYRPYFVDFDKLQKVFDDFMINELTSWKVVACLFGIDPETLNRDIMTFDHTQEQPNDPMFQTYMDCDSDVICYMLYGEY